MLSERSEFIYRHGMEQIFSDFILSHVSFAPFLLCRKARGKIILHPFSQILFTYLFASNKIESICYKRSTGVAASIILNIYNVLPQTYENRSSKALQKRNNGQHSYIYNYYLLDDKEQINLKLILLFDIPGHSSRHILSGSIIFSRSLLSPSV